MDKSPDAFRTISEVADALETPAHVLRFWESRFPQIKPVKRAGGRRYYRPADVALLGGIRHLLHNEGMTIRGVQKILREQGVRHVAAMAPGSDMAAFDTDDQDEVLDLSVSGEVPADPAKAASGQVLAMEPVARRVTILPDEPAEVVQLHGSAEPLVAPELLEGFMLPTANRRPLPKLDPEPPSDVPEAAHVWVEDEDWPDDNATPPEVKVEPLFPLEAALHGTALAPKPVAADDIALELPVQAAVADLAIPLEPEFDLIPEAVPQDLTGPDADPPVLAGIAARLRALPQPVSPDNLTQLTELQMRLGLLQAQMIEAARVRR